MSAEEIAITLTTLAPPPYWVTLSGGNPALFDLSELIAIGHSLGYKFALETQGSIAKRWFQDLDHLTVSPKPPSSGNVTPIHRAALALTAASRIRREPDPIGGVDMEFVTGPSRTIKIPIFSEDDYRYARAVHDAIPPKAFDPPLEFSLSVGNAALSETDDDALASVLLQGYGELIDRALKDPWRGTVRILPQLHALVYGNRRGV